MALVGLWFPNLNETGLGGVGTTEQIEGLVLASALVPELGFATLGYRERAVQDPYRFLPVTGKACIHI